MSDRDVLTQTERVPEPASRTTASEPSAGLFPAADTGVVRLLDRHGDRTRDPAFVAYDERADALADDELRRMLTTMVLARRFDDEATALQRQGQLALFAQLRGQEGAQAGSAAALAERDMVFPSYREHAVAIARGVDPRQILHLFRGMEHGGWDSAAHRFHLYTLVIGSHALHATGYAMGQLRDGVVGTADAGKNEASIVYFGDGATSQGDVNEAFGFAATSQAPVVFFCQNNQWAISVPTSTQSIVPLANHAAGFGIPAVRVDGNDPLACYAATAEALDRARSGGGPTFIEAVTFRMGAHTTSDDPTRYRSSQEEEYWAQRDPIARTDTYLRAIGAWDDERAAELAAAADALGETVRTYVRALGRPPAGRMFEHVYAENHSVVQEESAWFARYAQRIGGGETTTVPDAGAEVPGHVAVPTSAAGPSHPGDTAHRLPVEPASGPGQAPASPGRRTLPGIPAAEAAAPPPRVERLALAKSINAALQAALAADDRVMLMGEDIGALGGVFRVTDGLQREFGADRVVDSPLAESGIVGTAIGLALRGYRPVLEIQFDGFIFPAYDQITTQLAKMHYRSAGRLRLPIVIRVPYGGGIGAVEHHSESPEALFAHTAGLRVVSPATPDEAYVMLQEAIASDDPVLFFEPKRRYWEKEDVDLAAGPYASGVAPAAGTPLTAMNTARIARSGTEVTLVTYGPTVGTALKVAEAAAAEGRSVEVVDLRAISPLDIDTVASSVAKTGRCIVVHEAPAFHGVGAEVAAAVSERCFYVLEAPVVRVGGFHTPYPAANLEHHYLPGLDRILDAIDTVFSH